jgi:ribosomal protein S18 acetylase RimI-like enzyme
MTPPSDTGNFGTGMDIEYKINHPIYADAVAQLFRDSGIHRPVDNLPRIEKMIQNANLIITAWDGDLLVGMARSLTDFTWSCYLADLSVASKYKGQGIGKELIRRTKEYLGEGVMILLIEAPTAQGYYGGVGFTKTDNAWIIKRKP